MRIAPHVLLLLAVLGAAAVLLLSNLGNQYLWQDEAQTALIARTVVEHGVPLGDDGKNSFSQEQGAEYGEDRVWKWHPWFPFYLLAVFFELLGISTFTARLPFALVGLATVALTYQAGRILWQSRRAGLVAAALLASSLPFLLLSRQCRYYAPAAFFALATLYCYWNLERSRPVHAVLFFFSATLLFHTNFVHCAAVLTAVFLHAVALRRRALARVTTVCVLVIVVNAPWFLWVADVDYAGRYGNLDARTFLTSLTTYGRYLFADVLPVLFLPVVIAVLGWTRVVRRRTTLDRPVGGAAALLLLFMLACIAFQAVFNNPPLFRNLGPVIPVGCLLGGVVADAAFRERLAFGGACLCLLVYNSAFPDFLYEITHDYDGPIEGIVTYLNRQGSPDDVVAMTYGDLPVKFYTGMRVVGGLTGEDLADAARADWVILRHHVISKEDRQVREELIALIPDEAYRVIPRAYPDLPFENREDPSEHHYRTVTGVRNVVILQRMTPSP